MCFFILFFFLGVFPKMREASMKLEKLPITVPPFTTEASNTIHLHEAMAPPLLHLITIKKLMIKPMTQTLLPGEIGGKVLTFLYLSYLVNTIFNLSINRLLVSLLQVLCITKTNLTGLLDFRNDHIHRCIHVLNFAVVIFGFSLYICSSLVFGCNPTCWGLVRSLRWRLFDRIYH